jgi:hypothetical protein
LRRRLIHGRIPGRTEAVIALFIIGYEPGGRGLTSLTMIIVGLRVSCVIRLPAWSWGRRLPEAPFNITRMGNTNVRKRVALSIVRHAGDVGVASGRCSIGPGDIP